MNFSHTIFLVMIGYLIIALNATLFGKLRAISGLDIQLLPAIVACSGLISSIETILLVSFIIGLMFDSISANPLGVTSISLAIPGVLIYSAQNLFVKNQWQTQFLSGVFAGLLQPLVVLFLLLTFGYEPVFSADSILILGLSALIGGFFTPWIFKFVNWMDKNFNYSQVKTSSFRPDREIKRGR